MDPLLLCGKYGEWFEIICGLFEHYESDKQRNYFMIHLIILLRGLVHFVNLSLNSFGVTWNAQKICSSSVIFLLF